MLACLLSGQFGLELSACASCSEAGRRVKDYHTICTFLTQAKQGYIATNWATSVGNNLVLGAAAGWLPYKSLNCAIAPLEAQHSGSLEGVLVLFGEDRTKYCVEPLIYIRLPRSEKSDEEVHCRRWSQYGRIPL